MRVKLVKAAAKAQIHAALLAKCQYFLTATINALASGILSVFAFALRS